MLRRTDEWDFADVRATACGMQRSAGRVMRTWTDSPDGWDGGHVPLARHNVLDTGDIDELNRALVENFHSAQAWIRRRDRFRIVFNSLDLGGLSLSATGTTAGYAIHAEQTSGSLVLVCLSRGGMDIRLRHAALSCAAGRAWAMLDFTTPCRLSAPDGHDNLCVRFVRSRIEDALARLCGREPRTPLVFSPLVPCDRPETGRLWAVIGQIVTAFDQDAGLAGQPLLAAQYEQLLMTAALTCLSHNASDLLRRPVPPAPPKVVRLVEEFIEANADRPLRLGDLADLTGLGVRSIQLAFQKHRGYSPSWFLRECRLSRARSLLRRAGPGTTVTSVSLECGFASPSAFSRFYAARFGEKPLKTLRNHVS